MALAILQSSQPVPVFAGRFGLTRGTLPDTRPAIAEQRRTDSQVCRAGFDGGLEIAAHAGRDHGRARPDRAHGGGADQQPRERAGRPHGQRGDGHHAAEHQPLLGRQRLGQGRNLGRQRPAAGRIAVQAHLDQALDHPPGPARGLAEGTDQPQPVHRMHDMSVPSHAGALVRLQLPDEVPGEVELGALGGLRRRLGVAVLPDVGQAKLAEQPDVGRGPGLGHRDQRQLADVPPGRLACLGDSAADFGQPQGEFFSPAGLGHFRKSGTSRSSSSSKTTGRRRVAATSKVLAVPSACAGRYEAESPASEVTATRSGWPGLSRRAGSGSGISYAGVVTAAARSEDAVYPSPGTGALRIEPAVEAKLASGTAGALPLLPWPTAGGASSPVSPASNVAGPVGGVTVLAGVLGADALARNEEPPSAEPWPARSWSRPAAMTVTRTSSPRASSMTAPKMMFASTAAELETS